MRPICFGDVRAAARVLLAVPMGARPADLSQLFRRAGLADQFRRAHGRPHPQWGGGSLMAVANRFDPVPEPDLGDCDYVRCLIMVLEEVAARGHPPAER